MIWEKSGLRPVICDLEGVLRGKLQQRVKKEREGERKEKRDKHRVD